MKNTSRILKNTLSGLLTVLILSLIFLTIINICFNFLYVRTCVRGFSMLPTINLNIDDPETDGDTIYINPYDDIHVNDIAVAKVGWYKNHIIKRVVGTPGDIIEIRDLETEYGVYTNDQLIYTKEKTNISTLGNYGGSNQYYLNYLAFLENTDNANNIGSTQNGDPCIKLNDGEYFLMGDNWGETLDSVLKGPVKEDEIAGKVDLIVDVTNTDKFIAIKYFFKKIFAIN